MLKEQVELDNIGIYQWSWEVKNNDGLKKYLGEKWWNI